MNILSSIGNTPIVEMSNINSGNPGVKIYGKLEGVNPGGSIKDRPAHYMIKAAESSGELTRNKIILEATSGNTGIALAMIGAAKAYKVKLLMPECVSSERLHILKAMGAEVELTPSEKGTDGAIEKANQLRQENPNKYYIPNQFGNNNNCLAHYETTGPEIFKQTKGNIDIFVAGIGTTGTIMGASSYLKQKNKNIKIIGIEPQEGHSIQGLKNMSESMIPEIYDPKILDKKIMVDDDEAFETTRKLALLEGIFAGMSSGAAVAGAMRISKEINHGIIVVILPDRGERYLSTLLFRSFCGKCPP